MPWTRSWRLQGPTRTGAKTKTTFIFTDIIPLPIFASRDGAVSPSRGAHAEQVVSVERACRRRRLYWQRRSHRTMRLCGRSRFTNPCLSHSCLSHPTARPCPAPTRPCPPADPPRPPLILTPSAARLATVPSVAIPHADIPPTAITFASVSFHNRTVHGRPVRGRLGYLVTSASTAPSVAIPHADVPPADVTSASVPSAAVLVIPSRPCPSRPQPSRLRPTRTWPSWPSRSWPSRQRPSCPRAAVLSATVVAVPPAWVRTMDHCD